MGQLDSWIDGICEARMTREVSYSVARRHLAALLDEVGEGRNRVVITRRDAVSVALIAADELASPAGAL